MTAVEWLEEKLKDNLKHIIINNDYVMMESLFLQAKAMEKEQIIQAYSHGWHDGQDVIIAQVSHVDLGGDAAGEVHYTETYKKGGNQ